MEMKDNIYLNLMESLNSGGQMFIIICVKLFIKPVINLLKMKLKLND